MGGIHSNQILLQTYDENNTANNGNQNNSVGPTSILALQSNDNNNVSLDDQRTFSTSTSTVTGSSASSTNNTVSGGQIFHIQSSDLLNSSGGNELINLNGGQIFLQSIKRLDNSTTPILLYATTSASNNNNQTVLNNTSNDNAATTHLDNGTGGHHILLATSSSVPPSSSASSNVLEHHSHHDSTQTTTQTAATVLVEDDSIIQQDLAASGSVGAGNDVIQQQNTLNNNNTVAMGQRTNSSFAPLGSVAGFGRHHQSGGGSGGGGAHSGASGGQHQATAAVLYQQHGQVLSYQQATARGHMAAAGLSAQHANNSGHHIATMSTHSSAMPLNANGEPIKLPENLESLPKADHFPTQRHRWNTNEEIAAILISFERHAEWQSKEVKIRPKSGSMLLYSRKKVRYRRDGYCWKKRKDGKTTREDHMKLKVQGTECIYGCYVHSAILPTFHRRCYWLLQNPDIVLVHYLNVPYPDDNKLAVITPSLALWGDKKEWTKDELVSQLKPMFFSEDEPDLNNELEISTAETVEAIVSQLMEKQRVARQAALVKQLECGCPDSTCADGKTCSHPMRRITAAKNEVVGCSAPSPLPAASVSSTSSGRGLNDGSNQVSSTTGSGSMILTTNSHHPPRVYSRETRTIQHSQQHHHQNHVLNQTSNHQTVATTSTPPLVLSLSQIQGGGGLLILNSSATNTSAHSSVHQSLVSPVSVASFVCSTNNANNRNNNNHHNNNHHSKTIKNNTLVLKQEAMDIQAAASCCMQSSGTNTNVTTSISSLNVNRIHHHNQKIDTSTATVLFDGVTYSNGGLRRMHNGNHTEKATVHHNGIVSMSSAPSTPSKHMDTSSSDDIIEFKHNFCGDTVVLLGTDSSGSFISKSDGTSIINGGFCNETLDLSQEDIQRTLSANMPLCSTEIEHRNSVHTSVTLNQNNPVIASKKVRGNNDSMSPQDTGGVSEINPMDFIDCSDVVVSPTHVVDDDVFVNLDAFDMLGEFPELEVLDGSHGVVGSESSPTAHDDTSPNRVEFREGTVNITDYSPEWAYPEGGVKVLVTGPWYSTNTPYTVLFDTFPVPTTLVQSGVLRCFCPAHEAGLATLQVACEGLVISNSVIFEYKLPPKEEQTTAQEANMERPNDNLLKFTLLQRLEAMDDRLQIKQEPDAGSDSVEDTVLFQQNNFEERLVTYCQTLTTREWRQGEELSTAWFASHRGMTLLHLAASLGYSRLVCTMLHWRAENSSLLLETEVDALSQDDEGYTPLMWACAKGHTETAIMLYRWNHMALNIRNAMLENALECARTNKHADLAKEMEELEGRRERANLALLTSSNSTESIALSPLPISPASSMASLSSIASTSKSHDGVFLRPGAVSSSSTRSVQSPGTNMDSLIRNSNTQQRLSKRPSVDSGIHMAVGQSSDSLISNRAKSNKSVLVRDLQKLSRFDRSMSLPLNSNQDSPTDNTSDLFRHSPVRKIDFALCEVAGGPRSDSPLIDVEAVSDDDSETRQSVVGEQDVRVFTLAEQIIAAIPDRIKNESEEMMLDSPSQHESLDAPDSLSDVFMEPLLDQHTGTSFEPVEFNFEFSDHNYRYYDVATPCSSLSPASSSCLQSPGSFTLDSPSPPPTTADFCEFFQASGSVFEKDFSNLTLSDQEQRELYEAAKIIQKAYRSYKGRKKLEEQDKERAAAVLIQNYYRRYKQYAYFKQMTRAAMVIQNGYRSYCEHKRFKKSQEAAVCIQNYYRNYREQGGRGSREGTPASSGLKRTYSQRRQHQAARKIQQFMRQSKNKLQRERAEKEKQEDQSVDVRQRSPSHGTNSSIGQNSSFRSNNQNMDSSSAEERKFEKKEL